MGRDYETFIASIESENTAKIAKSYSHIGEYDYDDVTPMLVDAVVLNMKPKSLKDITTSLYIMSMYAAHLGNDKMLHIVHNVNRRMIWKVAKPNAPKKFISYQEYMDIYDSILKHEEHNAMYQSTLFACIYHGIYSDGLSVLKNLKASDVYEDYVEVHDDDGNTRRISVPYELSRELLQLGKCNVWWRNNRYGAYKIGIKGLSEDSCFKVESRNGSAEQSYRYAYYRILRKISKDYLGQYNRRVTPLQIFISGLMMRIKERLGRNGVTLAEAFADGNKDRLVGRIIRKELSDSGYDIEVRNFREIVKGHIDTFE